MLSALTHMYLLHQQRGKFCTSQKYRRFKYILILSSTALISAVLPFMLSVACRGQTGTEIAHMQFKCHLTNSNPIPGTC